MATQSEIGLQRNTLFLWLFLMATAFDGCSIYNGRIASNKLWDYKYFLVTVLLEKTKELSKKKRHFYWVKFLRFSAGNLLQLFKNKSMKALVDQYDINFVFCMKSWFLGFIIPLMTDAKIFQCYFSSFIPYNIYITFIRI